MNQLLLADVTFAGIGSPLAWLVLLLGCAAILVVTYRDIVVRSGNRWGWLLMLLRGLGLGLLLLILAKPTWTRETVTTDPGRVAVIVDDSLSMSLADPNASTRYVRARQAIESVMKRLDPRLSVDRFDLNGKPLATWPEQPLAERTDLARALNEAAASLRSRPLVAVVLASDGADNSGRSESDFGELAHLPGAPPVYTIGFPRGTVENALDLAVGTVRAPERAMVGNDLKIEVPIKKTGGPAVRAVVSIKRGKDLLASQEVNLVAGSGEQIVSVPYKPLQAGSFVLTASVEGDAGETTLGNNAAMFPLRVDAEKIRVLYVEGFLRPEYKFLKARLEDDPDIDLTAEVRRVNPEAGGPANFAREEFTPDRLKNVDIVILGDIEGTFLGPAEYQALLAWLEGQSKSLVVLGGYRSFGAQGFATTPLADVLPVTFAKAEPFQLETAFRLELTDEGRRHPAFEMASDRLESDKTWAAAPALLGHAVVTGTKPAATVLAVNPALMIEGKPAVIAAMQRFGGGHTFVLTADTTWRWSRLPRVSGAYDTLYSRFWSQTIRWLAGRSSDDRRPLLTVSTDRPDYDVNRPVVIRVERQGDRQETEQARAVLDVDVTTPKGKTVTVPVKASTAEPDLFTGTFYPSEGGRYDIAATLKAPDRGPTLANQTAEFLVRGADLELANPLPNPALLERIAGLTAGKAFLVDDVEELPGLIAAKERRTVRVQRTELWTSWWPFLGFLGVISAEWVIRRRGRLI